MTTITSTPFTAARNRRRVDLRRAATVAATGGIAWLAIAADSIAGADAQRYRDALFLVPWTLMALAYRDIHRRQADQAGRLERAGIAVLLSGMAIMAAGQAHVVATNAAENLAFPAAPALFGLGALAFGVGTARAGVFAPRVGMTIAASQFLTVALAGALSPWVPLSDYGNYSGAAMHGLALLLVADHHWRALRTLP